ncbi:MAG TPA: GNAT family N-acetyltransferase [Ktedonobacterales bacterium]|nr:GNAT family N-acetyltransferase [Ktedonobacterales bacterium]
MSVQPSWEFECGALWARDLTGSLSASPQPHATVAFSEAAPDAATALATAMGLAEPCEVQRRFTAGSRCFLARVEGVIAGYGWVSRGEERIGELERVLRMRPDEAYIWDCATLEPFRRQGIYSGLLAHIVAMLRREGLHRLWIGANLQNRPSLKGFAHAGFHPAILVVYVRLLRSSHSWVIGAPSAPSALVADARRSLASD